MDTVNIDEVRRLEKVLKEQKRMKQQEMFAGIFKKAGKLLPDKLRSPDSMIQHLDWYAPRGVSKNLLTPKAPTGIQGRINLRGEARPNNVFKVRKLRLF